MVLFRCLRSRKAAFAILGGIIAVLVGGLLLLIIGYRITNYLSGADATEKCRMSVFMADQAVKLEKKTTVDIIPQLQCDSKDVVIDVDEVTRARGGHIDDELMKQRIAEELYSCWKMVGAGKLTPLSIGVGFDRTHCLTCAKIKVSKDLERKIADENYVLKDFTYYIASRRLPKEEKSLYEYMTGKMPTVDELAQLKEAGDVMQLSSTAPLWVVWRIEMQDNRARGALTMAGLAILGVATAGTTPIAAGIIGTTGYVTGRTAGIYDISVVQSLHWLTSSQMSGKIPLGGKEKDTCSTMLN